MPNTGIKCINWPVCAAPNREIDYDAWYLNSELSTTPSQRFPPIVNMR
jgi:hypothetical protein